MEPVVIVVIVTIAVLIVLGVGVLLGRHLERRHWGNVLRRRAENMGLTVSSGYRTLEEQRRLRSAHYDGVSRVGVDPATGGEAVIEEDG